MRRSSRFAKPLHVAALLAVSSVFMAVWDALQQGLARTTLAKMAAKVKRWTILEARHAALEDFM